MGAWESAVGLEGAEVERAEGAPVDRADASYEVGEAVV